ncbi:adenylate isopentenyltransferase [Striga asiatica]|uniref:Adenylate isopentenyltransferase n=1 Tax=Striga asiatica TaxID=4170 RepID=A0A5A7PB43_STRAF|nr:adenylate isopentenyltransferase [Striga asiatica]
MASTENCAAVAAAANAPRRHKKVVVIMGPTGCGKSKLSVDLASRFFPSSEIINSDKIQIYSGLDVTSNKIPPPERRGVPHHLLGDCSPADEFDAADFRAAASSAISQISSRRNLPFVVGGSNSFVYALLARRFSPDAVAALSGDAGTAALCRELRYSCCFIWVDVSPAVLNEYLGKRVDEMMEAGMLEELAEYFAGPESGRGGLEKTIGVPEFASYFERYGGDWRVDGGGGGDPEKRRAYEEAVRAVKENTCQLAKRQLGKILRLRDAAGWELKRVDATAAIRASMEGAGRRRVADAWEKDVVDPSVKAVKRFLMMD